MDPDGSNLTRLAEHGLSPSWSPDNRQIVLASNRDGKLQIYAMQADGSNLRRLTNNKAKDSAPAAAPGAKRSCLFPTARASTLRCS
jgi:TolB protein